MERTHMTIQNIHDISHTSKYNLTEFGSSWSHLFIRIFDYLVWCIMKKFFIELHISLPKYIGIKAFYLPRSDLTDFIIPPLKNWHYLTDFCPQCMVYGIKDSKIIKEGLTAHTASIRLNGSYYPYSLQHAVCTPMPPPPPSPSHI